MERKEILIISRSFYPQNSPRSFRTTELAKELSAQGNNVTVLTFKRTEHSAFEAKHKVNIKDLGDPGETDLSGLKSKKLNTLNRVVKRFKEQFLLFPEIQLKDIVYKALKKEKGERYDLLISIGAPHPVHWGVAKALEENRNLAGCWVADCGDPFMLASNMQFKRPFYFQYFEKNFCKRADFITIPTEKAKEGYYPEFHDKIRVIPQGFRFEDVKLSEKAKSDGVVKFGYAGSLVPKRRDPTELLQFLEEENIEYKFILYSKNKAIANELVQKFGSRIDYRGEADRIELLYHLSEVNFVLNFENVGTTQSPSKLIDYAIIKKPILSVTSGNLNKTAVNEFLKGDFNSAYRIENPDQYRIENIARRFLALAE